MEEAVAKKKSPVGKIIFLLVVFAAGLCCYIASGKLTTESLLPAILFFIAGLACLIKGGDWFVDGATAIAKKFKIPEILIGATVVSIGTTLPEVMVSAQAAAKGSASISYGNAIGSIICNSALIAAITLAVKPAKVDKKPLRLPVIFFFIAAAFYAFNAYYFGSFSRTTGILLLVTFLVYMFFVIRQAITKMKKGEVEEKPEEEEEEAPESIPVALLLLVFGAAIIAFGANLLVDNGIIIAHKIGIPESVIALTFVALGTSLPELVTAITSLVKGHGALSLGNIIGANIFNLVLVSGLAITINPFDVPNDKAPIAGMNPSLLIDVPLVFIVMMILTLPAVFKGKLYRLQGILLLLLYFAYLAFQFLIAFHVISF